MSKVLVTGGLGFLGRPLVYELVKEGHTVRVLDDFSRSNIGKLESIRNRFEVINGDVRDKDLVMDISQGTDIILHLAAINGTSNFYEKPDEVLDVGTVGTINTIYASVYHDCERYVFFSSSEVYQEPPTLPTPEDVRMIIPDASNPRFSYGATKIIGEVWCKQYLEKKGVDSLIIRPHNIYGPRMGTEHVIPEFALRMKSLEKKHRKLHDEIPFSIEGDGTQTRSFCYIDDATTAIMTILKNGESNETYNVGVEDEVEIHKLAELVSNIYGVKIDIQKGQAPEGSTSKRCPDISKLKDLGFSQNWSLYDGLQKTCKWYWKNFESANVD